MTAETAPTGARAARIRQTSGEHDDVDLDVVIVTFNSVEHLPACVASLPSSARVIVVDNNSADGSADLAESLGCEVLRNRHNQGFARAVNQAVRERVHAPHLLLLNPDAEVHEHCLERLMAAMTMDRVAVAGPRLFDSDGAEQRPWWDFPSASLAWSQALGAHRFQRSDFTQSADVPFVVGACLLVRTDAFQAVGGFDERYWLYGEEADLCKRLSNEGWRVHYVAEASASHVGGASAKASPQSVSDQFLRGSDRFVLTHEGPARACGVSARDSHRCCTAATDVGSR